MTYILVPNSGQSLDQTRDPIRTNFSLIQTAQNQNHVGLGDSDQGKHKFLQMPDQGSAPPVASNECGFYGKAVSGVSQLFFRGENTGSEYQLTLGTDGADANIATFGTNTVYSGSDSGGWTFLPGGLILQYGKRITSGSSGTVTFPRTFPSGNPPFSITATVNASANVSVSIKSGANAPTDIQFAYQVSTSGANIYWMAIGN